MDGRKTVGSALAAVLVGGLLVAAATTPAAADTALVDYSCDIPPVNALIQSQVPDPAVVEDLEVEMVDTPDPVVQGQPVHFDIDYPVLDPTQGLPPAPPEIGTYGTVRIKFVELTATIPAGLSNVTAAFETPVPWATISVTGNQIKVRVQSPVAGSYITIEPDLVPPTIKIEQSAGSWIDLDHIPPVDIDATASGAPGTSIDWKPPTLLTQVKYRKTVTVIFPIDLVNWSDANLPCVPVDPNQIVTSTAIEAPSPALSVTTTAAEDTVEAGEDVHWTVRATNSGNVPLTAAAVTEAPAGCTTLGPVALAVGAELVTTCTRTTTLADVGSLIESATADTAETSPVTSPTDSVTVTGLPAPTVEVTASPAEVEPGETVDYEVSVTNEAAVLALTDVEVTGTDLDCEGPAASIGVGATDSLSCTHVARNWELGPFTAQVSVDSAETDAVIADADPVTVAIPPHGFGDVVPTAYYDDAVDYARFFGLVNGFAGNRFKPGDPVNRGQIVNMLWQLMGRPDGSPPHGFGDVPTTAFYGDGLDWAKAEGLVRGFAGNRYRAADPVNRCQLVNMVWNMVGAPTGAASSGYTDVANRLFCRPAVDWARAQGLLAGVAPGARFRPSRAAERGEVADVLHRLALTESAWASSASIPEPVLFDPSN